MKFIRKNSFRIAGIDLAALPENPTGVCIMEEGIHLCTLFTDEEIMAAAKGVELIAMDAPIMEKVRVRDADLMLRKYGALPPTIGGMRELTKRAWNLSRRMEREFGAKIIEVFPTATAKILGIYSRRWRDAAGLAGVKARNKHEWDAYLCALTALFYLEGKVEEVGSREKIVIPSEDAKLF